MCNKDIYILGISAYYHDSAAALIKNGTIVAAVEEERFSRKKHDESFPRNAMLYCLKEAKITLSQVSFIVFYEKPLLRFERILETFLAYSPIGVNLFLSVIPVWLKHKLHAKKMLTEDFVDACKISKENMPKLLYAEHHQSHAASAFFPSPFENAAILCIDGVGEWASTSAWKGDSNSITPLWEINFPHSLGLLYSSFTYYLGFKVNSAEYKVMGLAPYGKPKYKNLILDNLIDIKMDGTYRINMKYFSYTTEFKMINKNFCNLFGGPARKAEEKLTQKHMDLASSIQAVCEEVIVKLAYTIYKETGYSNLCMAGGVALNCVANSKILEAVPFKNVWIQPAATDAGGALGAALAAWYQYLKKERSVQGNNDSMHGSYLGPSYSTLEIKEMLQKYHAVYKEYNEEDLVEEIAKKINEGNVIGWIQGRMEFGPRALGNRSIIGDPRNEKMQSIMNMKIKFRESFRPFAPSIKEDKINQYFDLDKKSPYMLFVAPVKKEHRINTEVINNSNAIGIEQLKLKRSTLPAITHIDYSARVQTVTLQSNSRFYKLLDSFEQLSGCPIVINTSFNIRGEPIVCTPEEAYVCFMRCDMDYLVLGDLILAKQDQPKWKENDSWKAIINSD